MCAWARFGRANGYAFGFSLLKNPLAGRASLPLVLGFFSSGGIGRAAGFSLFLSLPAQLDRPGYRERGKDPLAPRPFGRLFSLGQKGHM